MELNLFEEMRVFAGKALDQPPESIVQMATCNSARALGKAGQIGELSENAFADLIAIPGTEKVADVYETVLRHSGDISASMIDGKWAIEPTSH